ncbi:MAG TPA: ECF-type sigma factor, partial [Blastocatellia bacterium]|nr:ECF-type sigma factor [Blastocatellia bacterium]
MENLTSQEVTALLLAWNGGDQQALDRLIPIVHAELHRLAHRCLRREAPGHGLQTTVLVNEAYLRLVDAGQVQWQNRAHFFAVSARLMRRILVDLARHRDYQKRGGAVQHIALDDVLHIGEQRDEDLVALDDALRALAEVDARKEQVIELRFFGGLSVEETAAVLQVSP